MKIGLHAHSLLLASGLREYQPLGRGLLTASALLDRAAQLRCSGVQLARRNIPEAEWDMVTLARLRAQAEDLGLTLHLSTNVLEGEELAELIRHASFLGATQVTVGVSRLQGDVKKRQNTLENLLREVDAAIKTAEKYKIMLAFENGHQTAAMDLEAFIHAADSEWIGVCFDMANPLTVPEDPEESARRLAPYCTSAHLKDWQLYRSAEGAMLVNCPIGEGVMSRSLPRAEKPRLEQPDDKPVNSKPDVKPAKGKSPEKPVIGKLDDKPVKAKAAEDELEITKVLRALKERRPKLMVFLQTAAERTPVPVLSDEFLLQYPRITARALASLLRRGTELFQEAEMRFPHERKASESEILSWEDERLKRSLQHVQKIFGAETLTLPLE